MRRFDKKQNIAKVNLLSEQIYLKSKGLVKENEGDFEKTSREVEYGVNPHEEPQNSNTQQDNIWSQDERQILSSKGFDIRNNTVAIVTNRNATFKISKEKDKGQIKYSVGVGPKSGWFNDIESALKQGENWVRQYQ
jgi:FtsZ-interacting cell division protein YlmF